MPSQISKENIQFMMYALNDTKMFGMDFKSHTIDGDVVWFENSIMKVGYKIEDIKKFIKEVEEIRSNMLRKFDEIKKRR